MVSLVFIKKINMIFSIYKRKLFWFFQSILCNWTKYWGNRNGPNSVEDSWLYFLLINSSSSEARFNSFSDMEKPNEWESGLPASLHQAWTISRIQSNVNERTILYLTADTLAWSRLLNFCFMLSGKTMPSKRCSCHYMASSAALVPLTRSHHSISKS